VEEHAARHRRGPIGMGTSCFAGACLVLALCLLVFNGIGTGVGASGVHASQSDASSAHARVAVASTHAQVSSQYWGTDDVPPRPKPPESVAATDSPVAQPAVSEVSATPPPQAAPTPTPAPAPPPPPAPAALPARGAASAYGCAAALPYLAAYAAPGFTFECPGYSLGHQAMTCINQPGVCDNEHLIVISDPCPAAYMNEASNSWVLTGASDAPIDPYGACS
jgi:hypothetical protein